MWDASCAGNSTGLRNGGEGTTIVFQFSSGRVSYVLPTTHVRNDERSRHIKKNILYTIIESPTRFARRISTTRIAWDRVSLRRRRLLRDGNWGRKEKRHAKIILSTHYHTLPTQNCDLNRTGELDKTLGVFFQSRLSSKKCGFFTIPHTHPKRTVLEPRNAKSDRPFVNWLGVCPDAF